MTHEQTRDAVIDIVSFHFAVTPDAIKGRLRPDRIAFARHCVAATLRNHGLASNLVGRLMDRDHGSILNSVHRHFDLLATNADYKRKAELVAAEVQDHLDATREALVRKHNRSKELEETKLQTRLGYERLQSRKAAVSEVTFRPHTNETKAAFNARVATAASNGKGGGW